MTISTRFVDEAGALLLKHAPLTAANEEFMGHVMGEIEDYDQRFSHPPSPDTVLRLVLPFEQQLKQQKEAQELSASRESVYAAQVARIFPEETSDAN